MIQFVARSLIAAVVIVALGGCAGMRKIYSDTFNFRGAPDVVAQAGATKVDLLWELIRYDRSNEAIPGGPPNSTMDCRQVSSVATSTDLTGDPAIAIEQQRRCLAVAFQVFSDTYRNANDAGMAARNGVQESLVLASESACALFKQDLNYVQSNTNFAMGVVTTVLAGAAAVVTPPSLATALAGSAAVSSGIRAEFNADLFFQQAAPTLTKAIDTKRTIIREDLRTVKQKQSLKDYPIEAAVADAIAFNDMCSLTSALQFLSDSVNLSAIIMQEDPGTRRLTQLLSGAQIRASGNTFVSVAGARTTETALPSAAGTTSAPIASASYAPVELAAAKSSVIGTSDALIGGLRALKSDPKKPAEATDALIDAQIAVIDTATTGARDATLKSLGALQTKADDLSTQFYALVQKLQTQTDPIELQKLRNQLEAQQIEVALFKAKDIQKAVGDNFTAKAQAVEKQLKDWKSKIKTS